MAVIQEFISAVEAGDETMFWDSERIEQLKDLWADGLSASQIARKIGGLSRSAVIGKVHRLGLAGRTSGRIPGLRPLVTDRPARVRREPSPPPEVVALQPAVVLEDGAHVTALTVGQDMCRWPIGDPQDREFHFCGCPSKSGSPYCAAHTAEAWRPALNDASVARERARGTVWR